ncbi:thioesterase family protein [Rhodococcus sp. X156]|uniref:thioesterase family protein n=1 Tax=Rhodococcus sp. X156 TaxID=2499145 RepID=UPI000FDBE306|nr:thioesterase family protein [Rhodococcus sp. X156]
MDSTAPTTTNAGPFRGFVGSVQPEWIDVNGHMNSRHYGLLIYESNAALTEHLGLGDSYVAQRHCGKMVVDAHIAYERELRLGEEIAVDSWLVGVDAKRLHTFHELYSLTGGYRAATGEQLDLHVSLQTRGVSPFAADTLQRLQEIVRRQCADGLPIGLGRRVRGIAGPS